MAKSLPEETNQNNLTNFTRLEMGKEEIDYLCSKFNIKSHGELFSWGVKLLYDLSKLDEGGWKFTLTKCEIDDQRTIHYSDCHRQVNFLMKWLAPDEGGFKRLPEPKNLDKIMKFNKEENK